MKQCVEQVGTATALVQAYQREEAEVKKAGTVPPVTLPRATCKESQETEDTAASFFCLSAAQPCLTLDQHFTDFAIRNIASIVSDQSLDYYGHE